jgi:hypothetical protein
LRGSKGRISHQRLTRISPLAVPIMLEVGKEPVHGEARDQVLEDAESLHRRSPALESPKDCKRAHVCLAEPNRPCAQDETTAAIDLAGETLARGPLRRALLAR